jgi:hypothetical protein
LFTDSFYLGCAFIIIYFFRYAVLFLYHSMLIPLTYCLEIIQFVLFQTASCHFAFFQALFIPKISAPSHCINILSIAEHKWLVLEWYMQQKYTAALWMTILYDVCYKVPSAEKFMILILIILMVACFDANSLVIYVCYKCSAIVLYLG